MSLVGQQLGEFEILELLGQGGMGAVYKARQTSLNRLVALKTLQPELAVDAAYCARFGQEARAAALLNHPNLVQVYSAGESEGLRWFAMEYVEGESAMERLERKGRLDPPEAIAIANHVAAALDYGWRKGRLIHRDIKPDNIFLSGEGEVKLGDLGLAKSADNTQGLTRTGASMGTPNYMSPEQVEGKDDIDLRTDIYSLGCTLYHLLTGQPPFAGNSATAVMMKHVLAPAPDLRSVWPECPAVLAVATLKMMGKQPSERQQSYEEVCADLRLGHQLLGDGSVHAPSVGAGAGEASDGGKMPAAGPKKGGARAVRRVGAAIVAVGVAAAALWHFAGRNKEAASPENATPGVTQATPGKAGISPARATPPDRPLVKSPGKEHAAGVGARIAVASPAPALQPPAMIPATRARPFVNTLGQEFVPVAGTQALFCRWDTRVKDSAAYAQAKLVDDGWTKQERDGVPVSRAPDEPVVGVSWEDAKAFCQWLTEKEIAEGKLPKGRKYRLPMDEEWSSAVGLGKEEGATPKERSARNSLDFPWGREFPPPRARVGNYADSAYHEKFGREWIEGYEDGYAATSPVGSFAPNAYGLYDMGGNVWQWCEDWYDKEQKERVLRGGSWNCHRRDFLLLAHRGLSVPTRRDNGSGFRCVLAGAPQTISPPAAATPPPAPAPVIPSATASTATKDRPWVNSLGQPFVPAPGTRVLFCRWDIRVKDYAVFARENRVDDLWTRADHDGLPVSRGLEDPVVGVNWDEAREFCQWLTEKERTEGSLPKGRYRLPMDEEWSRAAGLIKEEGATPKERNRKNLVDYPWGRGFPPPRGKVGNFADARFHEVFPTDRWIEGYTDGYATTSPVGSFPPNQNGLYDMGGNVWQWCEDLFEPGAKDRVARGASCFNADADRLLLSARLHFPPTARDAHRGFRCVLDLLGR